MIRKIYIKLIIILFILLGGGLFFLFREESKEQLVPFQNYTVKAYHYVNNSLKEFFGPAILRYSGTALQTDLTVQGVFNETNHQREAEGLQLLSYNEKLETAAKIKLADMFENHYFAHISIAGKGPSDLAEEAQYQYIVVGENLALGNFGNDVLLVQAWMDSPGHRANILKKNYKEIGVAVGEGMYEGEKRWLAVQEFGTPLDVCTVVDNNLESKIKDIKAQIKIHDDDLNKKNTELNRLRQENSPQYNEAVTVYNQLVEQYNVLTRRMKEMVLEFNGQVEAYNTCLKSYD